MGEYYGSLHGCCLSCTVALFRALKFPHGQSPGVFLGIICRDDDRCWMRSGSCLATACGRILVEQLVGARVLDGECVKQWVLLML